MKLIHDKMPQLDFLTFIYQGLQTFVVIDLLFLNVLIYFLPTVICVIKIRTKKLKSL